MHCRRPQAACEAQLEGDIDPPCPSEPEKGAVSELAQLPRREVDSGAQDREPASPHRVSEVYFWDNRRRAG
jgi:hypothetical protein